MTWAQRWRFNPHAPIFGFVLSDVPLRHAGSASGVVNAVDQVGGAVGVALVGIIFFGAIPAGVTGGLPYIAAFETSSAVVAAALVVTAVLTLFLPRRPRPVAAPA